MPDASSPQRMTRDMVAEMTANGCTPRDIASRLGISTQAVYQHLRRLDLKPGRPDTIHTRVR